jgi:hypothetical protein
MEHLTAETLARLVSEPAQSDETKHLAECDVCAAELEAYRAQTDALGDLPEIVPPQGDWRVLEARLRSEGLIEDGGTFRKLGLAQTPAWMKIAAALLLYLGGTGTGVMLAGNDAPQGLGEFAMTSNPALFASSVNVDDAASAVRVAEQNYVTALARYRELLLTESGGLDGVDPLSKYAALEHLAAASQAALRQAPGDPFFNGLLTSVLGEREATARMVSRRDNWF